MKQKYCYCVAGHCFSVEAEDSLLEKMKDYEPFRVEDSSSCLFDVRVDTTSHMEIKYEENFRHTEDLFTAIHGRTNDNQDVYHYYFEEKEFFWLVCEEGYQFGKLTMTGLRPKLALDFALTIIFRHSTIQMMTTPIHSSVVSYQGKAYLFLGISGTGKSTHSKLWLEHFKGTELVNDDKPIIRIMDNGEVRVFGSPWSGKTRCYRNVSYPVGGIVKLNQAPYNKIRRLKPVEAYFVLLQSISGKRWDDTVGDAMHKLEESIVKLVPMWHLECLPNEDAAKLCKDTITINNK